MPPRRAATLKAVAAAAGVHPATAAAVLNAARGNTRVAPATRVRVEAAARRLGYVRNESARRLRTGVSDTVGFVGGDLRNPFFAELAAALEDELAARGLRLVVAHVAPGRRAGVRAAVSWLEQQAVRGIVLWDESPQGPPVPARVPVVPIGFTTRARPGVWLDLDRAIDRAVAHLAAGGRRRLGFYAPARHRESPSVDARRRLFVAACRRRRLSAPAVAAFDGESWDIAAAAEGGRRALAQSPAVEAWLGFNDTASLGLLLARAATARRPTVVCFDGTRVARHWPSAEPCLDLRLPELARRAAEAVAGERPVGRGRRDEWLVPGLLAAR